MGKTPGTCDDTAVTANQQKARQLVGNVKKYGNVPVTVNSRDDAGNIELLLPMNDGSTQVLKTTWGDLKTMWAPCPSSLPSSALPGDPGPAPAKDSTGGLFISSTVLLAADGSDKGVQHEAIKWPREFAADDHGDHQAVKFWPTKIVVTGVAPDSGVTKSTSIDLLDPALAEPNQQITTDHNMLTLRLTSDGCNTVGVPFDSRPFLARAMEVIRTEKANPRALAAAWRIVTNVAEQLRPSMDDDGYRRMLQELLPAYEP